MNDIEFGERSGVDVRAYKNGLYVGGWYDSFVGIEGGFITWEQLDELRARTKRRKPYSPPAP